MCVFLFIFLFLSLYLSPAAGGLTNFSFLLARYLVPPVRSLIWIPISGPAILTPSYIGSTDASNTNLKPFHCVFSAPSPLLPHLSHLNPQCPVRPQQRGLFYFFICTSLIVNCSLLNSPSRRLLFFLLLWHSHQLTSLDDS